MNEKEITPQSAEYYITEGGRHFSEYQKKPSEKLKRQIISEFEKAGEIDGRGYFYLGSLYLPKNNEPFPDDYEKAAAYFQKVRPEHPAFYARAMFLLGIYHRNYTEDPLREAACMFLAVRNESANPQYLNYLKVALGKITKRKFWLSEFDKLKTYDDIDACINAGNNKLTPRCPYCSSTDIRSVRLMERIRRLATGRTPDNKRVMKLVSKHCNHCNAEWI